MTTSTATDNAVSTANRIMLFFYALIVAFLFASALSGCHVEQERQWEIDWRGFAEIPRTDRAIEIIVGNAPCQPRGGWYGGLVTFWPYPFQCGDPPITVAGCMPRGEGTAEFAVGYKVPLSASALPDEIGHYLFSMCGLGTGEDPFTHAYSDAFVAWLNDVRAALQSEGL